MMPLDFNIRPRHVQMFGAQGILAPLYQRQAIQTALTEEERRSQSRFEQMKALTELRAKLERPLRQAQIGRAGAAQELSAFQLKQAQVGAVHEQAERKAVADAARRYAAAPTQAEKTAIVREQMMQQGMLERLMPTMQAEKRPPTPTFIMNPETGMPVVDEQGRPVSVPGTAKFLPSGMDMLKTSRISLAMRKLKELSTKYNPESKREVRMDYSGLDWNSRAIKAIGIERVGAFGFGRGVVGGGRDDLMSNIMQVMATPATITDPNTGAISEDTAEFSRRANIIETFRAEIADEPEGRSKEKLKEILHNMEEMMTNARILSREEAQVMQSQMWGTPFPQNVTGGGEVVPVMAPKDAIEEIEKKYKVRNATGFDVRSFTDELIREAERQGKPSSWVVDNLQRKLNREYAHNRDKVQWELWRGSKLELRQNLATEIYNARKKALRLDKPGNVYNTWTP